MEANSNNRDPSDSVLILEDTLRIFVGANSIDISVEASQLADENGWTASLTSDHYWLFERMIA